MADISVIIPTYNRAKKVVRAIESVLRQTYRDYEIIVFDDGSTDNTKEVVRAINDNRLVYISGNKNRGAGAARNEGVRYAQGKYIAFLDSDDEWLPDKLEKQIEYIACHPEVGMVYGKMHVIKGEKEGDFPNNTTEGELEGDIYSWLLRRNTIGAPTMFIKKECFDAIGGFDESLNCLEDWEFSVRFAKEYRIGYIDEPLIVVHSSAGGVSSNTGGYFGTRCKIVSDNRNEMLENGILDEVLMDIFSRAQNKGVLAQVQAIIMNLLQE